MKSHFLGGRCFILLGIVVLSATSPPTYAASVDRWYAAIKASLSQDTMDNHTVTGVGTGMLIGGQIDGALDDNSTTDYTAGVGLAFGRRVGAWNISGEYIYRYRTDWDLVIATPSIQAITNIFSNVESHILMLNLARRIPINENWSWEAGAGLGVTLNNLDAQYKERATATNPQQLFKDTNSTTEFSYNVFVGVTRDLGEDWTLNSRLRYVDLGELEIGPFPSRPGAASADHSAVAIQFSLERDF